MSGYCSRETTAQSTTSNFARRVNLQIGVDKLHQCGPIDVQRHQSRSEDTNRLDAPGTGVATGLCSITPEQTRQSV